MAKSAVHALIAAAGQGARVGGPVCKQYLPIAGKPVLVHAIEAVSRAPEISGITVVIGPDDEVFEAQVAARFSGLHRATGGSTRAESVWNGLRSIRNCDPGAGWVLVHDAVRPCLSRSCLKRLLEQGLASPDGAILALPVPDTLKQDDGTQHIAGTVCRQSLWAAQTPQLFPLEALAGALGAMLDAGESPTDEAEAMENSGASPLLVMGSPANIKITWPDDFAVAEAWLLSRNEAE